MKEFPDKDVTAAIAAIRLDNSAGGMRNDFERAVAFILPTDPVKKGRKRDAATISAVGARATQATGKRGRGKGGKRTTGQGIQTLHSFAVQHRASFHSLQRCADHIALEVPNEHTRVRYLLDNLKECPDKDVTAAIAAIRLDNNAGGMRNDFERAVAFLLPTDPTPA